MEDFYNTSQDNSYTDSNITFGCFGYDGGVNLRYVVTCIIICTGLPLTLVAICAVYSLVQKDHVAPIYVINLLISDVIQLCCMISFVTTTHEWEASMIVFAFYYTGLVASVCFMVCVALERYLVIAFPLWYRFRRTIKASVVVCVVVWALPFVFLIISLFVNISTVTETIAVIFFLLPLPLLSFFLGGTLKALSTSISVPPDEKRRIVGMLVLVLLIYMVLFLPNVWFLVERARCNRTLDDLSSVFLRLSPLADLVLYVFMRKGVIDKLLASVCYCRMESNNVSRSVV